MVKDPVCAMQIEESTATGARTYEGTTYYFCSKTCLEKFQREPAKYVEKRQARERTEP